MVKNLGFIGEGKTEFVIINSSDFKKWIEKQGFKFIGARDATGRGNLQTNNGIVDSLIRNLKQNGAEKIFILTDLEDFPCVTEAKKSIYLFDVVQEIIIVPKAFEAWFLADVESLNGLLKYKRSYLYPEKTAGMPFDEIRHLCKENDIVIRKNDKVRLANRLLKLGFSIEKSAKHPNCLSSRYFIRKLKEFSEE